MASPYGTPPIVECRHVSDEHIDDELVRHVVQGGLQQLQTVLDVTEFLHQHSG